jgi:hypothetical protein
MTRSTQYALPKQASWDLTAAVSVLQSCMKTIFLVGCSSRCITRATAVCIAQAGKPTGAAPVAVSEQDLKNTGEFFGSHALALQSSRLPSQATAVGILTSDVCMCLSWLLFDTSHTK